MEEIRESSKTLVLKRKKRREKVKPIKRWKLVEVEESQKKKVKICNMLIYKHILSRQFIEHTQSM